MKKFLFILFMTVCTNIYAQTDNVPKYDITGAGSGTEGTILVKVYIYGKNVADADLKRAAVHGVVFRDCEGNESGARQPAMASPKVETENASFCKAFFAADGQCLHYASIIDGSYQRVKTKKGYKVGAIVQVDKTALRKELETAGLIKALSDGF